MKSQLDCGEKVLCVTIEPVIEARLSESAKSITKKQIALFASNPGKFQFTKNQAP